MAAPAAVGRAASARNSSPADRCTAPARVASAAERVPLPLPGPPMTSTMAGGQTVGRPPAGGMDGDGDDDDDDAGGNADADEPRAPRGGRRGGDARRGRGSTPDSRRASGSRLPVTPGTEAMDEARRAHGRCWPQPLRAPPPLGIPTTTTGAHQTGAANAAKAATRVTLMVAADQRRCSTAGTSPTVDEGGGWPAKDGRGECGVGGGRRITRVRWLRGGSQPNERVGVAHISNSTRVLCLFSRTSEALCARRRGTAPAADVCISEVAG